MRPRVRVVCGVLLSSNLIGRVLVAQRPPERDYAGLWEFPGGKVEPGETDAEALRREWHEELGMLVHVQSKLGEFSFARHDPPFDIATYLISSEERPMLIHHSALQWRLPSELPQLAGTPHMQRFLSALDNSDFGLT